MVKLFSLLHYSIKSFPYSLTNMSKKIGVCQVTSTNDKTENLRVFRRLVEKAAQENVEMVFFPEAVDYMGTSIEESFHLAEDLDGPLMMEYKNIAKTNNVWVSIGGFHERCNRNNEVKLNNCHVLINNSGEIKDVYRKLHLFDVIIPEKNLSLQESKYAFKGEKLLRPTETPIGAIGLSIDLRFPEVSLLLRRMGAQILTYPSAFTVPTGTAHWKTLLRARAIETQCYVVAAAQYGRHNEKRTSYGNSMIVDPWGNVLAECSSYQPGKETDIDIVTATVDFNELCKVRAEMPVMSHRRDDIYNLTLLEESQYTIDEMQYKFGSIDIPSSTVFYRSRCCYAFTNIKCVVPGHVLVSTLRLAHRLEDLSKEEITDLFETVVKVQKVMEQVHGAISSTICVQDGVHAGQTIKHVHCHILPRKENDFENNDDVYARLASHDREQTAVRKLSEMVAEAKTLRSYF